MKLTLLGSGASTGVPVIGCDCAVCRSENPRNKRLRASLLVEYNSGFTLLVDTSPDLRQQALNHSLKRIDAILYTHAHADHTHGIDDVRPFNAAIDRDIPAYLTQECYDELHRRFPYIWQPYAASGYWTRASLTPHIIQAGQVVDFGAGSTAQTFRQIHGAGETLGLRFGNVVYSTDFNEIPADSEPALQGMNVWLIDALRDGPAGSHNSLEHALALIAQFKPRQSYLIHMNHELEYEALKAKLPKGVEPAWDGLTVSAVRYNLFCHYTVT